MSRPLLWVVCHLAGDHSHVLSNKLPTTHPPDSRPKWLLEQKVSADLTAPAFFMGRKKIMFSVSSWAACIRIPMKICGLPGVLAPL